jgi:hypothetical protein
MIINLKIKRPAVIARMFDMHRVNGRKSMGVPAMDVIIYLPETRSYAVMERKVFLYRDDASAMLSNHHGKETAVMFKGMEINLNDKSLLRLCKRLHAARKGLVAYVRGLARA